MSLSDAQRRQLNEAICDYLRSAGFREAQLALERASGLSADGVRIPRLLERKWTSLVSLQERIDELIAQNDEYKLQLDAMRVNRPSEFPMLPRLLGESLQVARGRHHADEFQQTTLRGHRRGVNCLRFNPVFPLLASGGDDGTVKLWDAETGKFERTLKGHQGRVNALSFSPDGRRLATASDDLTVKVWALEGSFRCVRTCTGHEHTVSGVVFTPDGSKIISCSRDATIKVWHTDSGFLDRTLRGHSDWVRKVAVAPNNSLIASCSNDRTVKLWNMISGACVETFEGHEQSVIDVGFSPKAADDALFRSLPDAPASSFVLEEGGSFLLSASRDKSIIIWSTITGEAVRTLRGHDTWINAASFHPAGVFILSCSDDCSIRIWDLEQKGKCTAVIEEAHEEFVTCVDMSPVVPRMASGSVDNTIRFWECGEPPEDATNGQEDDEDDVPDDMTF